MSFFRKVKNVARTAVLPVLAAFAISPGLANNNACVANFGTIKNPTLEQLEEIYKLDGREAIDEIVKKGGHYPDTVSINLEGKKPYNIEELMGIRYIVAYGWNNGEPVNMYNSNGNITNITLLNPSAQEIKVVEGKIDNPEEAKAIASLLNYCGVESKNPYDDLTEKMNELTNKIEEIVTQYQNNTKEEINNLKLVVEKNNELQLQINNKITYRLDNLEERLKTLEEKTKKPESNFTIAFDITGLYGNNSSFNSDSSSGLGYKIGGTATFNIGNFEVEGGISYLSHKSNSEKQKGSTSTTTLEGTLGYKFGGKENFTIKAGVFNDSIKQRVEANDYTVSVEGNAFGPIIKLDYENDSIGVEAYLGKSLSGQAHQNVIVLGNAVNSNGILDVLKAGGKVTLPVYEKGNFKGNIVVGLDYKTIKSTYNDAFGGHNVSETNVYGGLQFKF